MTMYWGWLMRMTAQRRDGACFERLLAAGSSGTESSYLHVPIHQSQNEGTIIKTKSNTGVK
jgi:hypothetical protein